MPTLVSPGISVTISDESFFIPSSAPTVPLFFIATGDEKLQPDNVTAAAGTFEHNTIRTITSLTQSTQTYGNPVFLEESGTGLPHHGDARNEYGLFALNQYLGLGNRAFVVRANVNLNDDLTALRAFWTAKFVTAGVALTNLVNDFIAQANLASGDVFGDPGYKESVTPVELQTLAATATTDVFEVSSFSASSTDFFTGAALATFTAGYDQASTGTYDGFNTEAVAVTLGGGTVIGEYTAAEAAALLAQTSGDFQYTAEFFNNASLGSNDAARRTTIVTALQATVTSNTDIRSENFDYNIVLCPGYHEVVDEMVTLVTDINEEALVIADTPMDLDADGITNATTGWASTSAIQRSEHVAYYYPSALATNLDGKNVAVAASGTALRTITYSDNNSFLWFPPAGTRRGIITGISQLGYVDGALGGPTTFVELNLNAGQRDALYSYAATGGINPLVYFPGNGFVVWGQKTSTITASSLDRINVSRLIKYIKRQLRRNTLSFVFEPNDQLTRDNLKAAVDGFLGDLVVKRGLFDFATVCDDTNNTADRVDRNEMYIDVALKPIKAAEFIYVPIRILTTDAEL